MWKINNSRGADNSHSKNYRRNSRSPYQRRIWWHLMDGRLKYDRKALHVPKLHPCKKTNQLQICNSDRAESNWRNIGWSPSLSGWKELQDLHNVLGQWLLSENTWKNMDWIPSFAFLIQSKILRSASSKIGARPNLHRLVQAWEKTLETGIGNCQPCDYDFDNLKWSSRQ